MFGGLFGKKKAQARSSSSNEPVGIPPEIADIVRHILAYWTFNADEQGALLSRGVNALSWPELFRLHHLNCLEALETESVRQQLESEEIALREREATNPALERCRQTAERLLIPDSPYRPRHADVWQGVLDPHEEQRPTMQGLFCNPSLTHLGCLEGH